MHGRVGDLAPQHGAFQHTPIIKTFVVFRRICLTPASPFVDAMWPGISSPDHVLGASTRKERDGCSFIVPSPGYSFDIQLLLCILGLYVSAPFSSWQPRPDVTGLVPTIDARMKRELHAIFMFVFGLGGAAAKLGGG